MIIYFLLLFFTHPDFNVSVKFNDMSVRFNDIIFIDFDKECDDVCNMGKSVSEVSKVNAEADLIGKAEKW